VQARRPQDAPSQRTRPARVAWRPLAGSVAVAAALVASGCGELGEDWRGLRLEPPHRVGPADVARLPAGSPERAFAEWYAAVQRRDAVAAVARFAGSAKITEPALAAYWKRLPPPRSASMRITDVERRGRAATVFVMLTTRYVAPNGRAVEFRAPRAATLVRSDGAWRLPGSWFLLSLGALDDSQRRRAEAGNL
jgi:hypothetical protein